MASLIDLTLPSAGSSDWYAHYSAMDFELRARAGVVRQFESFDGATDDAKHIAGLAWQKNASQFTRIACLQFPAGDFGPLTTSTVIDYDGFHLLGPEGSEGPKNQEISTRIVGHRVIVASGSGTSSLYVQNTILKEWYIGGISWEGSSSSQWWHNSNPTVISIYPGEIHSCSWNSFGQGVLGNTANKFTITQFVWSGHNTILNFSNTPVHIGGSDCNSLLSGGYLNIQSPVSVAGGGTKVCMIVDYLEKSAISNVYCTNDAGWKGIQVLSQPIRAVRFYNIVAEGKAASSPATAACIEVQGGHTIWWGLDLGQVTTANGAFVQTGGLVVTYSMHYRQASAVDQTYPTFYQTAGVARHYEPVNGNGNSCRFRWSSAAASPSGVQIQDVPYPTTNKMVA